MVSDVASDCLFVANSQRPLKERRKLEKVMHSLVRLCVNRTQSLPDAAASALDGGEGIVINSLWLLLKKEA